MAWRRQIPYLDAFAYLAWAAALLVVGGRGVGDKAAKGSIDGVGKRKLIFFAPRGKRAARGISAANAAASMKSRIALRSGEMRKVRHFIEKWAAFYRHHRE